MPERPEERDRKNRSLTRRSVPSSREQTNSFVNWNSLSGALGQPFDVTNIPLSKLYQMRKDPMIAFALMYIKVPLIRAPWHIESDSAQVSSFVDNALRSIYGRLISQISNSLEFGYQAIIKQFEIINPEWEYLDQETQEAKKVWGDKVGALVWAPFIPLPPENVEPVWNSKGGLDGMKYAKTFGGGGKFLSNLNDDFNSVGIDHTLWFTNEKDSEFGSLYGYPRIGYAYRYWWSYWFAHALCDRHIEKDGDPAVVVRYPTDKFIDDNGDELDAKSIALAIGEDARSDSTIALPSSMVSDAEGRSTGKYEWDMGHLESGSNFNAFSARFNYLDVMKLRSIMVPENALVEGAGGTSSRNVASTMGDIFYESQAVMMSEIDDHINRFMIPQLVARNFPEFSGTVKKVTRGFSQADIALSKQLVQLIGQTDPSKLQIDVREVLKQAGVPLLSPTAIANEEKRIMNELEDVLPDDVGPNNGKAGVKDGLYIDGREIAPPVNTDVALSEFFANTPSVNSKLNNKFINKIADESYPLAKSTLDDIYKKASEVIGNQDDKLFMSEDDDEEKATDEIIKAVGIAAFIASFLAKFKPIQEKIMSYASNEELKKIDITGSSFDGTRPEAQDWIEKHGASLITQISTTTENEIKRFLADNFNQGMSPPEIATLFQEKFTEFSEYRSRAIVRSEIRDAYNAATLLAGQAEGVKKAKASDASGGRNINTDQHCIDRNGKVFSIKDALKEIDHTNGTLGWSLVPEK